MGNHCEGMEKNVDFGDEEDKDRFKHMMELGKKMQSPVSSPRTPLTPDVFRLKKKKKKGFPDFSKKRKKSKKNLLGKSFPSDLITSISKKLNLKEPISVFRVGTKIHFTNSNFCVEYLGGEKILIRVNEKENNKDVAREYKFLKIILEQYPTGKISPEPLFFDNTKSVLKKEYLVTEFVEGNLCSRRLLTDGEFIKTVAKSLRKLHSIKREPTDNPNPIEFHSEETKKAFLEDSEFLDEYMNYSTNENLSDFSEKTKTMLNRIHLEIASRKQYFEKLERNNFTHGDFHIGNIIRRRDESVIFIDYDFANWGCFYKDLAEFVVVGFLPTEIEEEFLEEYFGCDELEECEEYSIDSLWLYKVKVLCFVIGKIIRITCEMVRSKNEKKMKLCEDNGKIVLKFWESLNHVLDNPPCRSDVLI